MNLNPLCLAFTALSMVYLALAVYRRAPDRPVNKLFIVHSLCAAAWVTTNLFIMISRDAAVATFWIRAAHIASALGAVTFLDFTYVFPGSFTYAPTRKRLLNYATGLIGISTAFMPSLVQRIIIHPTTVEVIYGWPINLFMAFLVVTLARGDLILILKVLKAKAQQRVQIIYVLVGMALAHLVGIITILIIPMVWGTTEYSGWGAAGHIFAVGFIAYSIAKHRLMDISTALRQWASYAATGLLILIVALAGSALLYLTGAPTADIVRLLNNLALGGALAVIFVVAYGVIQGYIESRMGMPKTAFMEALRQASRRMGHTLEEDEICELVVSTSTSLVGARMACVYTVEEATQRVVRRAWLQSSLADTLTPPPATLPANHPLLRSARSADEPLYREDILRFRPLAEAEVLAGAMEEMDAEVVVPIRWEGELMGLLCTGPRENGQMYSWPLLEMLDGLCTQISLSLRNAQLYSQILVINELFEMVLRRMESGVITINEAAKVSLFNPAAARMLGLSEQQMLDHPVLQLPYSIREPLRLAHEQGQVWTDEKTHIVRPGGQRVPINYSVSLLTDAHGGHRGAVMVLNDMSIHEALEAKRREAERLALVRVLSAGMAHEIRNPLVAIRTFIELAPTRLDDLEFRSTFVEVAKDEIERIDKLVGQLLMLSRPLGAAHKPTDINGLVRSIMLSLSATAESRQVQVDAVCADDLPLEMADEGRLRQALMNVMLNAVEASPPGGQVRVTTALEHGISRSGSDRTIVIQVWNSGSSIAAEDLPHVFEPFFTKKSNGTGLGLAVCQSIIEEHGGRISADSGPDLGTQFTLVLPLQEEVVVSPGGDVAAS